MNALNFLVVFFVISSITLNSAIIYSKLYGNYRNKARDYRISLAEILNCRQFKHRNFNGNEKTREEFIELAKQRLKNPQPTILKKYAPYVPLNKKKPNNNSNSSSGVAIAATTVSGETTELSTSAKDLTSTIDLPPTTITPTYEWLSTLEISITETSGSDYDTISTMAVSIDEVRPSTIWNLNYTTIAEVSTEFVTETSVIDFKANTTTTSAKDISTEFTTETTNPVTSAENYNYTTTENSTPQTTTNALLTPDDPVGAVTTEFTSETSVAQPTEIYSTSTSTDETTTYETIEASATEPIISTTELNKEFATETGVTGFIRNTTTTSVNEISTEFLTESTISVTITENNKFTTTEDNTSQTTEYVNEVTTEFMRETSETQPTTNATEFNYTSISTDITTIYLSTEDSATEPIISTAEVGIATATDSDISLSTNLAPQNATLGETTAAEFTTEVITTDITNTFPSTTNSNSAITDAVIESSVELLGILSKETTSFIPENTSPTEDTTSFNTSLPNFTENIFESTTEIFFDNSTHTYTTGAFNIETSTTADGTTLFDMTTDMSITTNMVSDSFAKDPVTFPNSVDDSYDDNFMENEFLSEHAKIMSRIMVDDDAFEMKPRKYTYDTDVLPTLDDF